MGLDMYLTASRYVWSQSDSKEKSLSAAIRELVHDAPGDGKNDCGNVCGIDFRIGYWRKDNQIHNWIVEHCAEGKDECQDIDMSEGDLAALLAACKTVVNDPSKGPEVLPVRKGFFFGGYEYDDNYMDGVNATIPIVERALGAINKGYSITYSASW